MSLKWNPVEKHGTGWRFRITHEGRKVRFAIPPEHCKTERNRLAYATRFIADLDDGAIIIETHGKRTTWRRAADQKAVALFEAIAADYIKILPERYEKWKSVKTYTDGTKALLKAFSATPITGFTEDKIEEYKRSLKHKYSAKTINRNLGTLREILKFARSQNEISEIPKIKMMKIGKQQITFFRSDKEFMNVRDRLPEKYRQPSMFMLLTGLRIAECIGLTWFCVDLKNGTMDVAWQDDERGKLIKTKGNKVSKVALSNGAISMLSELSKTRDCERVFSHNGKPLTYTGFKQAFIKAMRAAGYSKGSTHTLRHTFAMRCLWAGVSFPQLSDLLTHASLKTTEVYRHAFIEWQQNEASKIPSLGDFQPLPRAVPHGN